MFIITILIIAILLALQGEIVSSTTNPEMVFISGGTFQMDSNDGIDYNVTVSDFYMSKYEITNEEYCCFLNDYGLNNVKNGEYRGQDMIDFSECWNAEKCRIIQSGAEYSVESGYSEYPVICVTWYGANEYCKWLSEKTGKTYRLATEAEWEYAAGGGSKHQKYAGTDDENSLSSYAWYNINGSNKTHKVGTKSPNEFGLYDMSGNVWEWCNDWYAAYPLYSKTNPKGPSSGSKRVYRGGSWNYSAFHCRVSMRGTSSPSYYNNFLGFRVVAL